VPLWWNADELPIGVHFLGRFGDEATLFRLASQLEHARPWAGRPLNQLVSDALMIPFLAIVVHELSYEVPKVPLPQRHDAVEALCLDRPDEALYVGSQPHSLATMN